MIQIRPGISQAILSTVEPYSAVPGRLWDRALSSRGEIGWVIIGQALAATGGLFGVRILTHWLPPNTYGHLALGLTLTALFQQSILSPFSGAALRFFSAARKASELRSFLKALVRIQGIASIGVSMLLAIAILALFAAGQPARIPLVFACTLFALTSSINATIGGLQNAARHRAIVAWHDGLAVWLRFLLGALAVILWGREATNAIAGYVLATLIVLSSQYAFFKHRILSNDFSLISPVQTEKWKNAIVQYGWPFATWGAFVWVQSASERWALQIFSDSAEVGRYAVLFQLSYYPMLMGSSVLIQIASPFIFRIADDGTSETQVRSAQRWALILTSLTVLFASGLALLAYCLHETIFHCLTTRPYWPVSYLMPWMILSAGLFAASHVASLAPMSTSSPKQLIIPKIATACLAVVLNIIGAGLAGVRGIVVASLIFSTLLLTWTIHLSAERT